jgi:hypothetical protein
MIIGYITNHFVVLLTVGYRLSDYSGQRNFRQFSIADYKTIRDHV